MSLVSGAPGGWREGFLGKYFHKHTGGVCTGPGARSAPSAGVRPRAVEADLDSCPGGLAGEA